MAPNSQKIFGYKENVTPPNIEICPKRLVAMFEYWYIERGLFIHMVDLNITIQNQD